MELLKQENLLNAFLTLDLREGKYRGLFIRVSGTNNSGQTLAVTNLGKIKLQHQGIERINADFNFFNARTNLGGGTAESASATSGAFGFAAIISFRRRFDRANVLQVESNKKTTLTWDSLISTLSTVVASGTMEVYGLYDDVGYQRYLPMIRTQQVTVAAATTVKETIPFAFVEELWGADDAQIARVQLLRDSRTIIDGTWTALKSLSNAQNNVETAVTTVEMIAPSGESPANVQQTVFQLITNALLTGSVFTYHYFACEPVQ